MNAKWTIKVTLNLIISGFFIIFLTTCAKIEREPKVETGVVSEITTNSAKAEGNIIDIGDGISTHGHCWSISPNPDISYSNTTLGLKTNTGSFTSILQSLQPGTEYYIKAYIQSGNGTFYGDEISFITLPVALPKVETIPTIVTSSTTAEGGGNVISDGGAEVTARGICWSTSEYPSIFNSRTIDGSGSGWFISSITGLTSNTKYYVRAYATNSIGTAYGLQVVIYTDPSKVTDSDGNIYSVITIGTQDWMTENLKTTKFNDGYDIPHVADNYSWSCCNFTTPRYCWYKNDPITYKNEYGALYNWAAVNNDRLCPVGWHVPSVDEWASLINYLGGEIVAGCKLKANGKIEEGTGLWHSPNTGATNETGFTALPGGFRNEDGSFFFKGYLAYYWSCTGINWGGFYLSIRYDSTSSLISSDVEAYRYGCSVRCLRD